MIISPIPVGCPRVRVTSGRRFTVTPNGRLLVDVDYDGQKAKRDRSDIDALRARMRAARAKREAGHG